MKLADRTDYAFRVLMYLAADGGRLATVGEIAARYGISHSHLTRVVWALGRAGFVETVRGKGGGLRLARPAEAIGVGAVTRSMEKGIPLAECFPGGVGGCRIETCCALKGVLAEAEAAFFAVLDRYSVDDLVRGNRELRALVLADPASELPSDTGPSGGAIAPRSSTTGRGAETRRDRRASADSRSDRRR